MMKSLYTAGENNGKQKLKKTGPGILFRLCLIFPLSGFGGFFIFPF